jgi:hypothetical protein
MNQASRLTDDQKLRLAEEIRRLIRQGELKQDALAQEISRCRGTVLKTEASVLSHFLACREIGIKRYLGGRSEGVDRFLATVASFLGVPVENLIAAATGAPPPPEPDRFHPAWPELPSPSGNVWFVDPGRLAIDFAALVDRVAQIRPGTALVIEGAAGSGKTTLLRRLERQDVGVIVPYDRLRQAPPDEKVLLVDDPPDPDACRRVLRDAGRRGVIARRPPPAVERQGLSLRPAVSSPDITLRPWGAAEVDSYLTELADLAGTHKAPAPPERLASWLREHPEVSRGLNTPRALGHMARHAAENAAVLDRAPGEVLALAAIDAASDTLPDAPRDVLRAHGVEAYALAAAAAIRHDPTGHALEGTPRAVIEDALSSLSGVTLASPAGRDALRHLLDAAGRRGRGAVAAVTEARRLSATPSADELTSALLAAGLWRQVAPDRLAPLEPIVADSLAAERLLAKRDGWKLLVETLADPSRDGVRLASARHIPEVPKAIDELLAQGIGRHVPAVRFAAAIAAWGPGAARPEQADTLVASAASLLSVRHRLNEAALLDDPEPLVEALQAMSRRYRDTLPRLRADGGLDPLLERAAPDTRRLVQIIGRDSATRGDAEADGAVPLNRAQPARGETRPSHALAQLMPWQAPWALFDPQHLGRLGYHLLSRHPTLLLDFAADGDDRARRIATGADADEHANALWSLWFGGHPNDALEALARFGGPEDRKRHFNLIGVLAERSAVGRSSLGHRFRAARGAANTATSRSDGASRPCARSITRGFALASTGCARPAPRTY